ncbi:MAG TPA: hypothetical protein VFN92_12070 [Solirubrobacterales bacterium]|nr:hypothetical protein [Solirubrobacterales bacterium]
MAAGGPRATKFQSIRSWDGSQDRAFEELCFQLRDPTPAGAELVKTGDPDAGVEWYWLWPDEREEGWQAKFIFNTTDLLKAMRESLTSVANKRPGLTTLTFCIPWDLPDDPSRARGKQARERFEKAKERWRDLAPNVEVNLLSGGQILERLTREEHQGRDWFFFNERTLSKEWCETELSYTIEDAGDRYTPTQDVELPVDRILEAVALPAEMQTHLEEVRGDVLRAGRELLDRPDEQWADHLTKIRDLLLRLEGETLIEAIPPNLKTDATAEILNRAADALGELSEAVHPIAWPEEHRESSAKPRESNDDRDRTQAQGVVVRARKVEETIWNLRSVLKSSACQAAERRALFVEGEAGQGKTHLFCDVAERLLAVDHPVVAVLGERFRDSSPWRRLAELLGSPSLSPNEIATIFAASGEARGRRAVLLIDALNETPEASMWATELADMRRRLTATGWVGFAVSCRSSYLDVVEPPGGPDDGFHHIEHRGYQGREFEAIDRMFALHNVGQPRAPLLVPEFTNPLFLKLYCEGLEGDPEPPKGAEHLSAIFTRFVTRRSARVERALKLDPGLGIVKQAILAFAKALADAGKERMGYREASALINGFATDAQNAPRTLMQAMASEGLLAVDRGWSADFGERSEMVSFPYQRFSDHLIVDAFLSSHLGSATKAQAESTFRAAGPVETWFTDAPQGLSEALAVQLPERWGIEILDLISSPSVDADFEFRHRRRRLHEAFLMSVTLRRRDAFTERSAKLINESLNSFREVTIEALFTVASDPEHPFNSQRVHDFLSRMTMAERDASWTIVAYRSFGYAESALDRLLRWAARGPHPWCEDEVVALTATAITWSFASPNRYLRDYGTKALASILIDRPTVHTLLVKRFAETNDPYITQRLVAAIYGAITRTWPVSYGRKSACTLLEQLLDVFIDSKRVVPDVETRDYIASLARWLRHRTLITPTLLARATPPYGSRPPKRPRSATHLEEAYPRGEDFSAGYGLLLSSALSSHSDWNRYVVSGVVDDFLPTRLGEPVPPPEPPPAATPQLHPKRLQRFLKSLSTEQATLYEAANGTEAARAFAETLSAEQSKLYRESFVIPHRQRAYRPPMAFPPERAARFIFQRTIELGWTPERFARFDRDVNRNTTYRTPHKRERFGKKYQWIARNELFARLADNFTLKTWAGIESYERAWQLRARSLDPTIPPEQLEIGEELETVRTPTFPVESTPAWWTPKPPRFEPLASGSESEWVERREDLPTPRMLHRVTDPDNRHWVVLDGYHNWRDDPGQAGSIVPSSAPFRDVGILSAGALFHRRDLGKLQSWLRDHPDLVRSLPDWGAQNIHRAFWAELPAESEIHEFPGRWRRPNSSIEIPVRSASVSLGYLSESGGYDCSLSESVSLQLPSRFLVEEGGLEWREEIASWVEADGREVVRHRQTDEGFHHDHVLIVEESWLRNFLLRKNLCLAIGLFASDEPSMNSAAARPEPSAGSTLQHTGSSRARIGFRHSYNRLIDTGIRRLRSRRPCKSDAAASHRSYTQRISSAFPWSRAPRVAPVPHG